jgi:hypothetical protein
MEEQEQGRHTALWEWGGFLSYRRFLLLAVRQSPGQKNQRYSVSQADAAETWGLWHYCVMGGVNGSTHSHTFFLHSWQSTLEHLAMNM